MADLAALYQQFDPLQPLGADEKGDALYVDWQKELAPQDVKTLLANSIALSGPIAVTRLFTGHRGVGKTTELMRVKRSWKRVPPGKDGSFRCSRPKSGWISRMSAPPRSSFRWSGSSWPTSRRLGSPSAGPASRSSSKNSESC